MIDRPTMSRMGYSVDVLVVAAKRNFERHKITKRDMKVDHMDHTLEKPFVHYLDKRNDALNETKC